MLEYVIKQQEVNLLKTGERETRYVACLDEKELLTTEDICKRVEKRCTLSAEETYLAIKEVEKVIMQELTYGRKVQLGGLGILHLSLTAESQQDKENVTLKSIKKINCKLRLSKSFEKFVKSLQIRKKGYIPVSD